MSDLFLTLVADVAFLVTGWFGAKVYYCRRFREDGAILAWLYAHAHTTTNDADTSLPLMLPTREAIRAKLKEEGHE